MIRAIDATRQFDRPVGIDGALAFLHSVVRPRYETTEVSRGTDLEMRHGGFAELPGPYGADNSTVIKILAGIIVPTRVEVVVGHSGKVEHRNRTRFIADHLQAVAQQAIALGTNACGYVAWTLMDNVEWCSGYDNRFGLCRVDFKIQLRTLTGGAA